MDDVKVYGCLKLINDVYCRSYIKMNIERFWDGMAVDANWMLWYIVEMLFDLLNQQTEQKFGDGGGFMLHLQG